ncbi:D-aminoacyl-tRNA deacylase [Clostridium cellulovorans]|uniref:D-aminoacyl-tRNA deacylase n=1 Tax=Clostridium cellulovorans (strain ATCC 35296 / DSM 3052 / OCM 3 / 743B) TaxID=573061 RepID=D9SMU7_CLOC7|nr:D-aminoacyl-tRNA deacylase [Clostridium cellulovorans]ADL51813.1 D-tyrosyl-tRNA(Tyr) deacylase [Clostridium cellulovorans 743B]
MRAVVQRVSESKVTVDNVVIGKISKGFNVLLGIGEEDTLNDVEYLAEKICNLRVFEDENQKLNKSLIDVHGEILIVSNFTIYGDCRRGRRPSFSSALSGEKAETLYEAFILACKKYINTVEHGQFGADMEVQIINDGPITLILDSKKNF